jgi:carboxypeptidase Q
MFSRMVSTLFLLLALLPVNAAMAQTFPTDDPVIKNIWKEAMDSTQLPTLAHELLDVIGPRLTGTPQMIRAQAWVEKKYTSWGIEARSEEYGKWRGWERGVCHIDLLEPRVRTLEGTMLGWSPGNKKGGVSGDVVVLPDLSDSMAFQRWLPQAKGKYVLLSQPQPTGRPEKNWEEFGRKSSLDGLKAIKERIKFNWEKRILATGFKADTLASILENAGASGVLLSTWTGGWGTHRVFGAKTARMPVLDLSLEDYNLLYRLAEYGDHPVLRVTADAKFLDPQPARNVIGRIQGSEKPDEYVVLSAHLDSWDAASGATDNGTGTLLMMETMRILRKCYPRPKRTILVGHWGGEEQGLNGSRAFVLDHPEIVEGVQVSFNQDNGTGRVERMSAAGFLDAGEFIARWFSRIPSEVTQDVKLSFPGMPAGGGSDNASFVAAGVPGLGLGSNPWDYFTYTWHTDRDTYDKLVFDDLKNNAVLAASLAYLASEEPGLIPREKRILPNDEKTGKPREWPKVGQPDRKGGTQN